MLYENSIIWSCICPTPPPWLECDTVNYQAIGLVDGVFVNVREDQSSISGGVMAKTQKIVLYAALFNTPHYKKESFETVNYICQIYFS